MLGLFIYKTSHNNSYGKKKLLFVKFYKKIEIRYLQIGKNRL